MQTVSELASVVLRMLSVSDMNQDDERAAVRELAKRAAAIEAENAELRRQMAVMDLKANAEHFPAPKPACAE